MTRTPNGNSSRRRLSEIASRPNLDAAYGPRNGRAPRPATELMLTMRPRDTLRSGRNACVTATTPIKFTSRTRRSSSSGNSSRGPAAGIPALFTSAMSGVVPRARSTSPRTRVMLAVSVTSIRTAVTPSRVSAISSSARRTVPKTRRPRPARCRAMAAPMPVEAPVTTTPPFTPGNLRPPCQGRRARSERRVDLLERDGCGDRPRAALHSGHADRRHLAVRSQVDDGRRGILRALVGLDHQRPGPFPGPCPLQSEDALSRGLGEVQLERPPHPVQHPFGGPGHDEPHRRAVMERVDQQERVARGLVVRVGGQLDRDPGRALQPEGRGGGGDERARDRGQGEATNSNVHGNLQCRLPLRCYSVREGLRRRNDPVDTAAGGQHVQLAGRVLAERRHVAEAHVEGPTGPPGDGTIRVGKTAQPPRTVVRVKVLPGQGWPAAAAVDEPPDD